MISRIMLSLKKAAGSHQEGWSLGGTTADATNFQSIKFFRPADGANGETDDDIPLDTVLEP